MMDGWRTWTRGEYRGPIHRGQVERAELERSIPTLRFGPDRDGWWTDPIEPSLRSLTADYPLLGSSDEAIGGP
mgnify:CR=1 FL=1